MCSLRWPLNVLPANVLLPSRPHVKVLLQEQRRSSCAPRSAQECAASRFGRLSFRLVPLAPGTLSRRRHRPTSGNDRLCGRTFSLPSQERPAASTRLKDSPSWYILCSLCTHHNRLAALRVISRHWHGLAVNLELQSRDRQPTLIMRPTMRSNCDAGSMDQETIVKCNNPHCPHRDPFLVLPLTSVLPFIRGRRCR
jgi:hypothetical protein